MTPFPEVELITIERLEVALRNKNMGLLKEGAYKLHEKYHSGHKFEYLDKLKAVYFNALNEASIPDDTKDILCSTIKDILFDGGIELDSEELNDSNQSRVSSLTQLSYNASAPTKTLVVDKETSASNFETIETTNSSEGKISAFDVFSAPRNNDSTSSYAQSPFQAEKNAPFQEFKMPDTQLNMNLQTFNTQETLTNYDNEKEPLTSQEPLFQEQSTSTLNFNEPSNQPAVFENYENQMNNEGEKKPENVAIFYCQDVSNEKIRNIIRYRELISKLQDEHYSINEILHLISEINTQSNTNILELKNILDQLQINKNKVNLVTNSSSANLIGLMEQGEYSYSLYEEESDKQINLVPVFGLSNQFICSSCGEIYLDKEDKINPLVLQCPKCKNPMFPNFYAANNQEIQMNLDYYNNALMALVDSDVWVVIHPILEDKVMTNIILSAIKLNKSLKQIYILDKDINIREEFKKEFISIKDDVAVNTNVSALEDFLNSIG